MNSKLSSGSDSKSFWRGHMTREVVFPPTQNLSCSLFVFLWGRGQRFSLKFSLSEENDELSRSPDGR